MNIGTTIRPSLTCVQQSVEASSEYKAGQNMDKGQWNIERASPYMLWNNSQPEKNPTARPGIKPGTPWSIDEDVTLSQAADHNQSLIMVFLKNVLFMNLSCIDIY